jgi:hypothetical protein
LPVTGGQAEAHAAEQLELPPLSASNRYTVSRFGPAARIVPSFECLVVTSTVWAAGAAALVVDELVVDELAPAAALP